MEPRKVLDSTVVFNELMYHPADDNGPEWIELYNQMSIDMDLSEWRLADGVEFEFPAGTILGGGDYLVVASDPTAIIASTGLSNVLGPFTGRLSNGGETIELRDLNNRVMDSLDYEDRGDWPLGADGSGATLAKKSPLAGSAQAGNWTMSGQIGGTPGILNFSQDEPVRSSVALIQPNRAASWHVPTTGMLGDSWTRRDYQPGSLGESWISGQSSAGFRIQQNMVEYAQVILQDQPLTYWRLDERTTDGPARNRGMIGSTADGDYLATASVGRPSLLGAIDDTSMAVNGAATTAALTVPAFEKYAPFQTVGGTGFSIELWLEVEDYPASLASVVGDGEGALDFSSMIYLTPEGRLRSFQRTTATTNFGVTTIETLQPIARREATHIVATWDQTNGLMKIFVNGLEAATQVIDGVLPNTGTARNSDNRFFLGRDQRNTGGFDFQLDEVALYNRALDANRIVSHFDAGRDLFGNLIATDLGGAMHSVNASAYMRVPFEFGGSIKTDELQMHLRYDDGFVAYLNGTEVARRNSPTTNVVYNSQAMSDRTVEQVLIAETIDLGAYADLLRTGDNLLAIQAMNSSPSDSTFLMQVELTAAGYPPQTTLVPDVMFSEIQAAGTPGWQLELYNPSDAAVSLGGLELVRDGATRQRWMLPNVMLAADSFHVLSAAQMGFTPDVDDRLFLYTAGQTALIDARAVSDRLQGLAVGEQAGQWLYPSRPTFGAANEFDFEQQIVINEIMYHAKPVYASGDRPFQESSEEWLELYHRGSQPLDLSGWTIQDAIQYSFPAGTVLQPGNYLVVARDLSATLARYPELSGRVVGNYSGSLANSNERIRLVDAFGNPADEVHYYDGGRWPDYADAGGSSLELIDVDANNASPEAWAASDPSELSEWQTVTYRGIARQPTGANYPQTFQEFSFGLLQAGELLIDDIHVIEDPDGTALELIQNSTFTDGLDRWRAVGNHQGAITADPSDPSNAVFHLVASGPEEHLQNHVETTLKNDGVIKRIVSGREYEVSFRAKWLAGSPQLNTRLFFNYLPQTTILQTPTRTGTPGQRNSRAISNQGPTYRDLMHEPISPTAADPVIVSVRADDPDGVRQLDLVYLVDDGPAQTVSMTRSTQGWYRATIPPQANGRTVQFYLRGTDGELAETLFPAAGPSSRALYRVGDRARSTTGLQELQILMTPTDEAWLNERTHWMSNRLIGATVVYEGQVYYDVGVRLKGSEHGRPDPSRRGYYLRFAPDELFRGVHSSIAIDRSGGWRFGRTFGQDEILIYQFFNRAGGIPSQYNDLMFVDGPSAPAGTAMIQLARYGDVYLDSQYENGSDGMAYEYELIYAMQGSQGPESEKFAQEGPAVNGINVGTDLGDNKESYRHYFLIENNRDRDDYRPLIEMARALRQRNEAFTEATDRVLDVDQWMRAFAALSLSGTNDNYAAGAQHNAIFYQRPSDGKMLFFPFDMDFAFIQPTSAPLSQNADLNRFRQNPNHDHAFLGHLLDILETSFNRDYMERWVQHVDSLLPAQNLSSIMSWITDRAAYVRRNLPAQVPFEIATDSLIIDSPSVRLEGRGWVDVKSVRLRGSNQTLPVRWTTNTAWQVDLPLTPGRHELQFDAFDLRGRSVGSDSVIVVSQHVPPLPGDLNGDGQLSDADLDRFCVAWRTGQAGAELDLNGDQSVDLTDHFWLLSVALQSTYGDANLDRRFDSQDLILVFQSGKYEDAIDGIDRWAEGDWNCDGRFDSSDLVVAFQGGGYSVAAQVAHATPIDGLLASEADWWNDSEHL